MVTALSAAAAPEGWGELAAAGSAAGSTCNRRASSPGTVSATENKRACGKRVC